MFIETISCLHLTVSVYVSFYHFFCWYLKSLASHVAAFVTEDSSIGWIVSLATAEKLSQTFDTIRGIISEEKDNCNAQWIIS